MERESWRRRIRDMKIGGQREMEKKEKKHEDRYIERELEKKEKEHEDR